MRYIIRLAALCVVIGGLATIGSAQAPSGSYQQTCRKIGVRGNVLYAECQDADRHWRSAQLVDYNRCRGEIQNLNGSLQCTDNGQGGYGPGGYGPGGHGQGGYDHDRDRDRDRDHDHDGDHDRDRRYGNLPYGSYSQTCQNIQVNGNELRARCQKKNGGWRDTSLRNFDRCREIENNNGKLRCR